MLFTVQWQFGERVKILIDLHGVAYKRSELMGIGKTEALDETNAHMCPINMFQSVSNTNASTFLVFGA